MTILTKPASKPANPNFSSGPCTKRPGWSPKALEGALLGRSHRSKEGKARLKLAIDKTKAILGVPEGFVCAIMPGSDTGAFEAAMWSLLGERGVDVLAWESFGSIWVKDAAKQLKLEDLRVEEAPFGVLPDLSKIDFARDLVLTANGTTAGVRLPNYDFIPADRKGLVLVDATSAAFAQDVDWSKVDALTFSWQKVMGGEAAHGMLILSPRAIARLESYVPSRPLPKLFQLTKGGKLNAAIFEGETINTPSMMAVEDYLDTLAWAERIGGAAELMRRADANAKAVWDWIDHTPWVANLALDRTTWSNTSVCLKIVDPDVTALSEKLQAKFAKDIVAKLESEGVAYDFGAYRDAPAGLRIWCGSTVETSDVEALLPWLDWAFSDVKAGILQDA
ncbi:MAG TPA: phosphoserine transaminase [Hyphomicrobiaceae bacterium]|nr:phosphoserine transaminase [Hyphomicrobiaceae bacterium]